LSKHSGEQGTRLEFDKLSEKHRAVSIIAGLSSYGYITPTRKFHAEIMHIGMPMYGQSTVDCRAHNGSGIPAGRPRHKP